MQIMNSLCNQSSHHRKHLFTNLWKPSHHCELTPWAVSKKKWDTQEDKSKSMMRALYVLQHVCQAEATSNSEKIKPVALAVIELQLSEGKHAVSH